MWTCVEVTSVQTVLSAMTGWLGSVKIQHHLGCQLACRSGLRAGDLVHECVRWGPNVLAGVSSQQGVQELSTEAWPIVQSSWVELPTELSRWRENVHNSAHLLLQFWRLPSDPTAFPIPQPSLWRLPLSPLLCRSCSIVLQLSLRKNRPKCRCAFIVFLEDGEISVFQSTISDLPLLINSLITFAWLFNFSSFVFERLNVCQNDSC